MKKRNNGSEKGMLSKSSIGFDFNGTPLLISLPLAVGGTSGIGRVVGTWRTEWTSRTQFRIERIDATLEITRTLIQLSGREPIAVVKVPLSLGTFDVPEHLTGFFPHPNEGLVSPKGHLKPYFV